MIILFITITLEECMIMFITITLEECMIMFITITLEECMIMERLLCKYYIKKNTRLYYIQLCQKNHQQK